MKYLLAFALCAFFCVRADADLVINELRTDQPSSDVAEYFELYANGMNFADLSDYTYIVIGDGGGGSGTIENVTALSGSLNAGEFFLVAESTFNLTGTVNLTTGLNFENSDNVTHVLVQGFSGANGDDLDTDDDGTLDVTPWTSVVDAVGLVETVGSGEQFYGAALGGVDIGPNGNFVPAHVFREVDGTGDFQIGAFDPVGGDDTPGATNASVPEPSAIGALGLFGLASLRRRTRKA